MRAAIDMKYANLAALFGESDARLRRAGSDVEARAVFDRIVRRVGDGHVGIAWPGPQEKGAPSSPDLCADMGFDARHNTPGIGPALADYHALSGGGPFPAGLIESGGARIGIVRIGVFQPIAIRADDGARLKALPIQQALPSALTAAKRLARTGSGSLSHSD
jgi:hypothetical protein